MTPREARTSAPHIWPILGTVTAVVLTVGASLGVINTSGEAGDTSDVASANEAAAATRPELAGAGDAPPPESGTPESRIGTVEATVPDATSRAGSSPQRQETQTPSPTSTLPVELLFREGFDDRPEPGAFILTEDHVNAELVDPAETWLGDHSDLGDGKCGPPTDKRTVRVNRGESVYWCDPPPESIDANHLMTSMGNVATYSTVAFTPNQTFNDVTEVHWDANITDMDRQWIEVKIIPAENFDPNDLPCANDWMPCADDGRPDSSLTHAQRGSVGTNFFHLEMRIDNGLGVETDMISRAEWDGTFGPRDPAIDVVAERRHQFFRDNGNGTMTWGVETADGSYVELTETGSFPAGAVYVVFADHNYTPGKGDTDTTFTWHWDNLAIYR